MALSEDQRALLRLLLAGETYEQIAELLGTTPAQIRERAEAATTGLEADPAPDLDATAVRSRVDELQSGTAPSVASTSAPAPSAPARDRGRRWSLWIAIAGAAAVVAVVLVVALGGSGGGGGDTATPSRDREDAVTVRLAPVGGSGASGTITIVRVADQPAVDLDIRGLTPSGPGQTYVLWFVGGGGQGLPIAFQAVGADGRLTGRTPIPSAASGLLPNFQVADLTLAPQRAAGTALKQAAQSGTLPQRVGTSVLRGNLRG